MNPITRPRLLLIDGHGYIYRAFYAIRSLASPNGEPTNAIYGFIKMLQRLRDSLKPSHILVVWDDGLDPGRMNALPDYKAHRPPTPPPLEQQLPAVVSWLEATGIASWSQPETEADDWIATYTRRARASNWEVIIASSDKDFLQLVCEGVGIVNPNDKMERIWTAADVQAKTGVGPHQIVDWLSLIGDSVDNIPGVSGVGPKTAADLLKKYGSIDQLLERLVEIKAEKLRGDLWGSQDQIRCARELVRLRDALENGPALESLTPRPLVPSALRDMFGKWGFKSMLAELEPESAGAVQGSLL